MEKLWSEDCGMIQETRRTEQHRALCVDFLCTLRTYINMLEFFNERDRLFDEKSDMESFHQGLETLREIGSSPVWTMNKLKNSLSFGDEHQNESFSR